MEKVFNAYIHSLASKREYVSTFYEKKRIRKKVCTSLLSILDIDAITRPNVFILPTLCQGPKKLAFEGLLRAVGWPENPAGCASSN